MYGAEWACDHAGWSRGAGGGAREGPGGGVGGDRGVGEERANEGESSNK